MSTWMEDTNIVYGDSTSQSTAAYNTYYYGTAMSGNRSVTFNQIPALTKKITVVFDQVTTNGTSPIIIQAGTVYGYSSMGSTNWTTLSSAAGLLTMQANANTLYNSGVYTLSSLGTTSPVEGSVGYWSYSGTMSQYPSYIGTGQGGFSTYGSSLNSITITTLNGTDTFTGGITNIIIDGY